MQPPEHRVTHRAPHQGELLTGPGETRTQLVHDRGDAQQLADGAGLDVTQVDGVGGRCGRRCRLVGHGRQLYARTAPATARR